MSEVLGTFHYNNPQQGVSLSFELVERKGKRRANVRVTGSLRDQAVRERLGVECTDRFAIAKLVQAEGEAVGMRGAFEAEASDGERSAQLNVGWTVRSVDRDAGVVIIDLDDGGEVTYEASSGGKCKDVINIIGFGVGIIVTIGGLIMQNPWIVATGAGMTITFGGRVTGQGSGFMDPGDGNWKPGVWY